MVVLGAGGFAKELIDVLTSYENYTKEHLFFYDEININSNELFGFKILHYLHEVEEVFNNISKTYCLGVGTPKLRYNLNNKVEELGGELKTLISRDSILGKFDIRIETGSCIMENTKISNGVIVGKGSLVNADVLAGHDVHIGKFCDIAPGVKLTGHCQIGNYVHIGAGAIILPKIMIGDNCIIAGGSVVTNNIPANSKVVGIIPSRVIEKIDEFEE